MLLDDDVVTDGKTKPSSFPGRLGRKERVEQLFPHLRRNARAVVAYGDLDLVAEVLRRRRYRRLVITCNCLRFALSGRIKAIGNQIEQDPRNLLWEQIDITGSRVKGPFQGDIEALLFGSRPVIGKVEALIDQGVDIDRPVLSRPLTGMQQHVLDDGVGALAVLHHLAEIALQRIRDLADLCA